MARSDLRNVIVVGLAMFAIYFGAGNLIFPPHIGVTSGANWVAGLFGLLITGITLPILAVIAVGNAGGFHQISRPIAPWFYVLFNIIMMYSIGLLVTIPRTGAMAYESGTRIVLGPSTARRSRSARSSSTSSSPGSSPSTAAP